MDELFNTLNEIANIGIANFTVGKLCYAVVVFLICLLIIKIIMRVVNRALNKANIEKGLHKFVKSSVKIILLFLAIIIAADILGIPITSLVALFSVLGLAISLAVQSTLANLANGIMILLTKPFHTGDYIEAAGVSGTVNEIQLVYTKLKTADNKVIYVPNNEITSSKIVNYTREDSRRAEIKVTASYECKTEDVKNAIKEAMKKSESMILKDPEPFIRISAYRDSDIEYTVRVWAKQADYWTVYFDLLENIRESFEKNNVKRTYNNLNVYVKQ